MPLPKPKTDEEKPAFISRCMGNDQAVSDFPDSSQRRAVCETIWDQKDSPSTQQSIDSSPTEGDDGSHGGKQMIRQYAIRAEVGKSEIRTFLGRKHSVIPLIALVEGVLQGVNAPAPEFISESEMAKNAASWNGRPVVIDHPRVNGELVSANLPDVLETELVGIIFNSHVEDGKLKQEAWLDHGRNGGSDRIEETLAKVLEGEIVELSTGFFADIVEAPGSFEGEDFQALITNIVPDHLAILSESTGACSVADGCGTNRVNSSRELRANEKHDFAITDENRALTIMQKVLETFKLTANTTFDDIIMALQGKLAKEFADRWFFIFAVTDSDVIFMTFEGLFQRTYQIAADGSVSLGDETIEVRPETDFVPLTGNLKEKDMPKEKIEALVKELIANENTQFTESDSEWLTGLDEAQLTRMSPNETDPKVAEEATAKAVAEALEAEEAKKAESNSSDDEPAVQTFEDILSAAPDDVRESIEHGKRLYAERRGNLIAGIKANKQNKFSDADLKVFDMGTIERLASLAQVEDFSGQGLPRVQSQEDPNAAPKPLLVFEPAKAKEA